MKLIFNFNKDLLEILLLSLKVNFTALLIASIIGLPLGALLGSTKFPLRLTVVSILNTMMSFPPVVIGLLVYLHISRSGPLGWMGLLYTPSAMIVAQIILIFPIIAALTCQIIEVLDEEYKELFKSFSVPKHRAVFAYIFDCRYSLCTVILAGLGRAMSEVGAVIIVGGNIDHLTRILTTSIALETSKGNLSMALALGIILLFFALIINSGLMLIREKAKRMSYA